MTRDETTALMARLCALTVGREGQGAELPRLSPDEVESLRELAFGHRVSGWIMHQLTTSGTEWEQSAEVARAMRADALAIVSHNARIIGVSRKIQSLIGDYRPIFLKGAALIESPYYDDISHRLAGDIDLLVGSIGDAKAARDILTRAGAKASEPDRPGETEQNNSHLPALTFMGVMVEIHHKLFNHRKGWELPTDPYSHKEVGANGRATLDAEATLFHLTHHAYGHQLMGPVKLGWFIDIAQVVSRMENPEEALTRISSYPKSSAEALKWAIGTSMSFMPTDVRRRLQMLGYEEMAITAAVLDGHAPSSAKAYKLASKMRDMASAIKRAEGVKGKARVLVEFAKYEAARTRAMHPADSIAMALIKRIFKKK